jgi:tRNA1Val (adenine37-N6)-methyltransferase
MTGQPFKFKQFTIQQDKCAMKIGTDAVLLGSWADVSHNPENILDIGAGSGVISLMLAQRSTAEIIDAVEIESDAYEQCVSNFENSLWNDRLFCYHASLQEFVEEIDDCYDLIISNPPFYTENYKTNNAQRDQARFQDALPLEHLLYAASKMLSKKGRFAVIIPFDKENRLIELAEEAALYPARLLRVKGNSSSNLKRSLIEFSFQKNKTQIEELVIETERHNYTEEYIKLTKDFYLKM